MRLILLTALVAFLASCSTVKKASAPAEPREKGTSSSGNTPVFIENISIKPGTTPPKKANAPVTVNKAETNKTAHTINTAEAIEVLPTLRFKYSILLDEPVEALTNEPLLEFLEEWYGTRYRLGGNDKTGIDCSAFVQSFLSTLYGLSISRTCKEQYHQSRRIKRSQLQEGDLVFFKTRGRTISHVGVYLRNNKFVHASTSSGVMISDLSDEYFAKRYAGAGRM
ncbi:MAG TPA: NlpC/P60 family protein [Chitinophagaceae bacterium]|nr:NlpC/P60 family protein [Chitinophagaceae bacterium]